MESLGDRSRHGPGARRPRQVTAERVARPDNGPAGQGGGPAGGEPVRNGTGGRRLRPGSPLLAAAARPWAGAFLACCAALVAVLGTVVAHQTRADGFDRSVDSPFIAWFGSHQGLGLWLVAPGSLVPVAVLSVAIAAACLLSGRLNGAVLAATAVPVTGGLTEGLLKPLVHRTYLGDVVYPSGHTAATFAIVATVTTLLAVPPRPARGGALRTLVPAAGVALGIIVAIALVGLRWHYFTDTVAGAAVGAGTVCGLALVLDLPAVRRWLAMVVREPPPAR